MDRTRALLLVMAFSLVVLTLSLLAGGAGATKLELIHVLYSQQSPLYNDTLSDAQRLQLLIGMDSARQHYLLDRRRRGVAAGASSTSGSSKLATTTSFWAESPMESGAFLGLGQYLVSMAFGTPPQEVLLIADTGSDLIWLQCSTTAAPPAFCPKKACSRRPAFVASKSATLSVVPCSAAQCLLVPAPRGHGPACSPAAPVPCGYAYDYADGSSTTGFLARDTATISNGTSGGAAVRGVAFGCGTRNQGGSFSGTGGVIGLGQGQLSFPAQSGSLFAQTFSYCLLDLEGGRRGRSSSFLFLGRPERRAAFAYTPLVSNPLAPTFYYVGVVAIRVGNRVLPVPGSEWAIDVLGNGGTVIDSGSTLTYLRLGAYLHLVSAFAASVHLPRIPSSATFFQGLELCYNVSSSSSSAPANGGFPRLTIDFAQGLSLELPTGNYLVDVADDVKCLAIRPTLSPFAFNVLGNLMQQGYHVEFDRASARIGFARTECVAH
ncbi:aspartyl protease family protein 2 [Selaginella moellendorffii]|nr:aspartyl protease family protein 2 [Selaginella moellendorffii]|eukprot:XP_002972062.2 aspartyl protease family protein 2 [Selaginella moellendorffii]